MLACVLCILLPVSISMIIYNALTRDAVKEQAMSNAQESLRLVEGYVSQSLKLMLDAANFVQLDSEMNLLLKEAASAPAVPVSDDYEQFNTRIRISNRLDSLSLVGGYNLYISILLNNNEAFTNYSSYEYDPKVLFRESWNPQWVQQTGYESYWIPSTPTVFLTEKSRNPYQISVVRTLRAYAGEVYGYAIVTLLESQINQLFGQMAAGQEIMIVDEHNTIISHADRSRIGSTFEYAQPAQNSPKSQIAAIGDQDYLVSTLSLPFTGWGLVSVRPYAEAAHKINSIFSRVFLFQLLFVAVFLILLLYLIGKFTSPLVRLGQVVKKVELGNLEIRSNIRGSDEVGHLSRSFDRMLDRVKEMIYEVSVTESRKREAEMAMLQAQINPHFLFN
ncbi:MAG: sensor histidine kinase, partial [Paenibacillus sp.]|nr:sensor histidine kinase [Paenibacillus sp.]